MKNAVEMECTSHVFPPKKRCRMVMIFAAAYREIDGGRSDQ